MAFQSRPQVRKAISSTFISVLNIGIIIKIFMNIFKKGRKTAFINQISALFVEKTTIA
jgi:hypothetical protein